MLADKLTLLATRTDSRVVESIRLRHRDERDIAQRSTLAERRQPRARESR
jgi:hypothetical protein